MIETSKGLPQKEGLIASASDVNPDRCIIDKPFLFGKYFIFDRAVQISTDEETDLEGHKF